MIEPAIVVIAYNREKPLRRLLKSLAEANYSSEKITLHISIDASDVPKVKEIADAFEWKYGEKVIDLKTENLGLLKHILTCGELTDKYESIIVLEDDLVVAPSFYNYAVQANNFYSSDEKIAGVSLYTYSSEENNFYPFQPIHDKGNIHFIQVASSWGQSWNKDQWSKFILWLTENPKGKEALLPDYILNWGTNSWKKLFINYLIDSDRYFVFPKTSYSTNFEDEGTHASNTGLFQVQLNYNNEMPKFCTISESNSVYDVYFELTSNCIKKRCSSLQEFDVDVDLYGAKPVQSLHREYVLTSRRGVNAVKSFGAKMKPLLQNVLSEIEGDELGLYRKEDLRPTEKNRFSVINAASVRLDHYSKVNREITERATIVVPVSDEQLSDLEVTLKAMNTDRFYNLTLLIVCSPANEHSVSRTVESAPVEVEVLTCHSENVDDLLRFGIAKCSTNYCSWIQPGMTIDLNRVEGVARVFQGMSQVQILHGLQNEVNESNYLILNTASGRWTPQRANSNKSEALKLRSELVFWRKSLISQGDISKLSSENLFLELLKLNPIYVVALKLGSRNGMRALTSISLGELEESLSASEFQPKGGFRLITRPIFQYFFRRNVPFFRLFYRETEQLPLVIRYDFKNNSFYFDNY
ncbi:MAG: glycosyltransferase [Crocinitomicaceae bacterium]|nr:glycosyltransferase [Flavobacteriales bacterium]NQZ34606.1 glycosyltransferase [Crocinitomicaceae bacterium]